VVATTKEVVVGYGRQAVLRILEETSIVAVVRVDRPAELTKLAAALREGGVRMVEITMTTPGALKAIEGATRALGDDVFIGAGTVLDATTARLAISAGAAFIVGPAMIPEVIVAAHLYGVAVIPGCLTPTEIAQAWSAGADALKLFPGRVATPGYFRDIKGPFPQVKMLPTGNVDLDTAPEYIKAGAIGVGVGRALVDERALREGNWAVITENARQFGVVIAAAKVSAR
jgi:2-dehydro-3-deoxyphosphogluconate aldolase/(4S)-4-hydroxy-2-oxoglutarate aldolase